MDKKRIIAIVSLIAIIVASIITNVYILSHQKKDDEFKIDGITGVENKGTLKDSKAGNLDITDITLFNKNGTSVYKAKISNNTNEDIYIDKLYVIFYDNDTENKKLALSDAMIKANSETYINISSPQDLTKSTDIKYVLE